MTEVAPIGVFECRIGEYSDYLREDAFRQAYRGIGTLMLYLAGRFARSFINPYCAARFLTVDADIEHDEGVLAFYEKNSFVPNGELFNKHRKTISMRADLYA